MRIDLITLGDVDERRWRADGQDGRPRCPEVAWVDRQER